MSHEVTREVKRHPRAKRRPSAALRTAVTEPSSTTLIILALAFFGLIGVSAALSVIHKQIPRVPAGDDLISVATSMWQVEAGIAALALPILIFVIERSRDERLAALPSAEVLGRESLSLPIIGFAFLVVARMGLDLALFAHAQAVFVSDVVLFWATMVGTLFAYVRVVQFMLSPSRLRDSSVDLLRLKARNVFLRSVRGRIGNNLLFNRVKGFGVDYWPFGSRNDPNFLILDAPAPGYFVDVHIDALRCFIDRLPWVAAPPHLGVAVAAAGGPPIPPPTSVWLLRQYGARLYDRDLALLRLSRSAFRNMSATEVRSLERQFQRLVRIRDRHEL